MSGLWNGHATLEIWLDKNALGAWYCLPLVFARRRALRLARASLLAYPVAHGRGGRGHGSDGAAPSRGVAVEFGESLHRVGGRAPLTERGAGSPGGRPEADRVPIRSRVHLRAQARD